MFQVPPSVNSQKNNVVSNKLIQQFVKYVLVGGVAFAFDFATLYTLTDIFHVHYLMSATIGFLVGLIINYGLCLWWIFDVRTMKNPWHEFSIFAAIGIAGLVLNNALLYGLTEWFGIYYLASKVMAATLILLFNFSLRRVILFSEPQTSGDA